MGLAVEVDQNWSVISIKCKRNKGVVCLSLDMLWVVGIEKLILMIIMSLIS